LVREKAASVEVGNSVEDEATWNRDDAVCAIPDCDSSRLLFALPPGRSDEHEARVETRLKDTEEEPSYHERFEIGASAHTRQDNAPKKEVDSDVFASGKTLHKNIRGVLCNQVADVENADQK